MYQYSSWRHRFGKSRNGKPLNIIIKRSILEVAAALDPLLYTEAYSVFENN